VKYSIKINNKKTKIQQKISEVKQNRSRDRDKYAEKDENVRTSLSSVPMMDCPVFRINDSLAAVTLYNVSEIYQICKYINI
jgi:hypothetical protein